MRRLILLCLCIIITAGCENKQLYKDTHLAMGTYIEVTSPDKRAAGIVFDEIRRIENLLSKYKPESEVSRLNKLGKLKASPETFFIIRKSKEFWQVSNGAFDITVAPLMDLWGFTDKHFNVSTATEIKSTLKLIGSDKIILHQEDNVIEFSIPGMKIDLGGIAKGYAFDCAVKKLKENNVKSCLIAAGQVYALGDKFGSPWKVAVKNPQGVNFAGEIELRNQSVATSGNYEQYFIKDGVRYSHILNPKTGFPADSGLASVTVIAPDALTADALSTAIFVMGKREGEKLADKLKIQCLIR